MKNKNLFSNYFLSLPGFNDFFTFEYELATYILSYVKVLLLKQSIDNPGSAIDGLVNRS